MRAMMSDRTAREERYAPISQWCSSRRVSAPGDALAEARRILAATEPTEEDGCAVGLLLSVARGPQAIFGYVPGWVSDVPEALAESLTAILPELDRLAEQAKEGA